MSVHPSVRPSVDKVSRTFWKNNWLNSFRAWISWSLFMFVFLASFLALWWLNIWPKMGFPDFFEKTIGPIHFIPGIYPYGVSLLTPIHFHAPGLILGPVVDKYLAENGVSRTFWKKLLAQFISYLVFNPDGVSLLTPIHFRVPSLIFGPLVAKYLAENEVSGTFWKNYWFHSKFSWRIPNCVAHDCKIEIFIGYFWMRWVVIRAGVYCPHLWAQLV